MSQFGIPGYQQSPQLSGLPGPNYAPFGQMGNPGLDMMLSTFVAPMLQSFMGGKFLPQQFPAQGLLDQMVSAKWQQSSRANLAQAQAVDQQAIYRTMAGMRGQLTDKPMTDLQKSHLDTFAGVVNNPVAMGMFEMAIGAQNTEDLFFGRRGSATRLASAVNRIGFSRADSITGKDRMSEDSLKAFSSDIYSNLYGPGADLNDVSGFSAGRVGDIMTDLAQRKLLPASMSKLTASERRRAFEEAGGAGMKFSENAADDQAIKKAMGGGESIENITKIAGGAEAVRKVDATRVANSIKGYTDALGAVREIFGDNGMTNAPMQQLLAAMEGLTQNSISSMSPGKIENVMRRTQMASRDAGVSLEALMGLSARGGALAEQYGLAPELASGSVITAMEQMKAMEDTGRFRPAFGRMDPNKAALTIQDQSMRADASPVGKYLAVASRLIAENSDEKGNVSGKFAGSNMAKMVEAMKRGETSYYDETEKRNVNIYEEFGSDPDKIMRRMLQETGTSVDQFGAMYRDKNTQEFQVAGAARSAQAEGLKSKLAGYLSSQTGISERIGGDLNDEQRSALSQQIGKGLSTALIDDVNNTMDPKERLAVLKSAFNQSAINYARQQLGDGASVNDVMAYAQTISKTGKDNIMGFKTDEDLDAFLSTRQANAGEFTDRRFGQNIEAMRQTYNSRTLREGQERGRRNVSKAGMSARMRLDGNSNLFQRFSDMLEGKGSGTALEQVLGAMDSKEMQEKLMEGVTGGKAALESAFNSIKTAYTEGTVDTKEDKEKLIAATNNSNFSEVAKQFAETEAENDFKGKTSYMKDAEVAKALDKATTKEKLGGVIDIYRREEIDGDISQEEAEKLFADPAKRQEAMAKMAQTAGIQDVFLQKGIATGIGADVMTQAQLKRATEKADAFEKDADRNRVRGLMRLAEGFDKGEAKGKHVLDAFGVKNDDAALNEAMKTFMEGSGNSDAVAAQLKKLGLGDAQIKEIVATTELSRNINDQGGFANNGGGIKAEEVAARAGRQTAFETAARENKIKGRKSDLVRRKQAGKKLSAEEEKELKEFYASEDKFNEELALERSGTKGPDKASDAQNQIKKDAKALTDKATGPGSASDPMGIGAALTSSVVPAIADAFKTAISELAKLASGGGELVVSGSLSLIGLEKVIADLTGKPSVEATPAGPPTVTSGNSRFGATPQ
jgi:hypothetical protein